MAITYQPTALAAITVSDFQAALAWYNNVLGFATSYVVDEMGWGEVNTPIPGFTIGIQTDPGSAGKEGGATVTFSVADIEAARAELESKGVRFDGPINEIPGMVKLTTFSDPDGNHFMFAQTLMA